MVKTSPIKNGVEFLAPHPLYGLVLSGGGARAAYQAGALQGIAEIVGEKFGQQIFPIITGLSAGAINASFMASGAEGFTKRANQLAYLWNELVPEQVLRTDIISLGKLSAGWIKDLSFGGIIGDSHSTHIFDSTPLIHLLRKNISFGQIKKNIENKSLHGVSVSATCYTTGTSVAFYNSLSASDWVRSSRISSKVRLGIEHVLASSSIPLIFKPVKIGNSFFGDGGIRSNAPLSPAIHLGAERILAIGVRYPRNAVEVERLNHEAGMTTITFSDIAGVMFNSLFLDAIEFDYERLQRINETVDLIYQGAKNPPLSKLKKIPTLLIQPSIDLGVLAADQFHNFPKILRYLLKGIGASDKRGADLLSYIAFDRNYTKKLVEIGLMDVRSRREEIANFFNLDTATS